MSLNWFKRKKDLAPDGLPWTVEYRLRLLHMVVHRDGDDYCTGCGHLWVDCPTLEILDKYGD